MFFSMPRDMHQVPTSGNMYVPTCCCFCWGTIMDIQALAAMQLCASVCERHEPAVLPMQGFLCKVRAWLVVSQNRKDVDCGSAPGLKCCDRPCKFWCIFGMYPVLLPISQDDNQGNRRNVYWDPVAWEVRYVPKEVWHKACAEVAGGPTSLNLSP